ncbi:hypothetical protein [Cellulosimicrobium cellulans]|uniref:hypothetical protein n=1 Tax=Cellulosimicrobium cellulans TaxID=1710 RepID=UPI002096B17C|nr:hypothetical protein [Cellulosimicrobium cellulans]MCO7271578.1 hypothetical protein [Cellulosimicrobium cellulans]
MITTSHGFTLSQETSGGQIAGALAKFLHIEYLGLSSDGGKYEFRVGAGDVVAASARRFDEAISTLKGSQFESSVLFTEFSYEVVLDERGPTTGPSRLRRGGKWVGHSDDGHLKYEVDKPTDAMAIALCLATKEDEDRRQNRLPVHHLFRRMRWGRGVAEMRMLRDLDEAADDDDAYDLLSVLSSAVRTSSLRLVSERERARHHFETMASAVSFEFAFQTGIAVALAGSASSSYRTRSARPRRSSDQDLGFPQRRYVESIVGHYIEGLAEASELARFLSFYHVAEHFFDQVLEADIVRRLQGKMTEPGFSVRRPEDVATLIPIVKKNFRARDDQVLLADERAALALTLRKYVVRSELETALSRHLGEALNLYFAEAPEFVKAGGVVRRDVDDQKFFGALAQRLYAVRNALVHRKSAARGRYEPAKHRDQLARETAVMQVLAEQIILGTSTIASE